MSTGHDDFAFEPAPGLPAPLPQGERLLWQGSPDWKAFALAAFRLRGVAIYFALVAAWRAASVWADGGSGGDVAAAVGWAALLALAALAILSGLGWVYARTTIYSLTTKRLVIRSGVALPVTLNIPLALVETATLVRAPLGTGSVVLTVEKPNRIAWLALWPSAKPFAFNHPQPMLRALADAEALVPLLADALAATGPGTSLQNAPRPARAAGAAPAGRPAAPGPYGLPA
jgi:hypothetical protein